MNWWAQFLEFYAAVQPFLPFNWFAKARNIVLAQTLPGGELDSQHHGEALYRIKRSD